MSTLREVAEAAGVDVSTVSRVLNGRKSQRVSPETRRRIRKMRRRTSTIGRPRPPGRSPAAVRT